MSNVVKIQNLDLLGVALVSSDHPYVSGERAKNKKKFNRYSFGGRIFTVDTEHPFCEAKAKNEVGYLELTPQTSTNEAGETVESYNFSGAFATHKAKYEILSYERKEKELTMWNIGTKEMTAEEIQDMLKED